jgi:hypothetical protein
MARARRNADLQANFEAILGEAVDAEGDVGIAPVVRSAVGTSQNHVLDDPARLRVTSRETDTVGDASKTCDEARFNEVTGRARTGGDGTIQFLLSDFYCPGPHDTQPLFRHPLNVVATPRSSTPLYLTCTARFIDDRRDVQLTVRAWDQSGQPAPNISFDWRCLVPYGPTPTEI